MPSVLNTDQRPVVFLYICRDSAGISNIFSTPSFIGVLSSRQQHTLWILYIPIFFDNDDNNNNSNTELIYWMKLCYWMLNWHQSCSTCFPNTGADAFHWRSLLPCLKREVFWFLQWPTHSSVRWLLLFCILIGGHGCFVIGICVRSLWWWLQEKMMQWSAKTWCYHFLMNTRKRDNTFICYSTITS